MRHWQSSPKNSPSPQATAQSVQPSLLKPLLSIALGVSALTLALQSLGLLQLLELASLDQWFRSRPSPSPPTTWPVVIVSIDDADIAANGQWPLTDQKLAELLTRIEAHAPTAIGLDLYRDLPVEPGSAALQTVFNTLPNLIGIEKIVGEGSSIAIAPPPALQAKGQVAFNDLVLDSDGHVRRHLLSMRHNEQTKFALGTQLALIYLEQRFNIVPEPLENSKIRLGKADFYPLRHQSGAYANLDAGGYQILANYLLGTDGVPTVSMTEVMTGGEDLPGSRRTLDDLFYQKIVLIGVKAESSWGDRFYTPYSRKSDETWAGVEIHANLTAQIIASALNGRSPMQTLPNAVEWIWILLWSTVGVLCNRKLSAHWQQLLRFPLLTGGLFAITYGLFLSAYWLPLIAPLLALGSSWIITQGYLVLYRLNDEKRILELAVQVRTQALSQQNQALEQARIAAEVANQAKGTFLAHISHELRTPLTAILGFGALLEQSPNLPQTEKDYAETINRCGEHLLALINTVLELSKIEAGSTTLTRDIVHLPTLLLDIQKMFRAQAQAKQLSLSVELMANSLDRIEVDAQKLRQILINLLGNALKFTQSGQVTLNMQVIATNQSAAAATLTCAVEDTGPGLTDPEIEQLFQAFVQTAAGKSLRKGTGLGLALVRQWIDLMAGTIEVSSTYGQGSCFTVCLPVHIPDKTSQHTELSSSPQVLPSPLSQSSTVSIPVTETAATVTGKIPLEIPSAYRILIVDDEADNRRLLSQWFSDDRIALRLTKTGTDALSVVKDWRPHLILLDIHLPDIDGYEVARRIRAEWVPTCHTAPSSWLDDSEEPVILAITAGVLHDRLADLLAAGCDDVVWKPMKAETLFSKLSTYL